MKYILLLFMTCLFGSCESQAKEPIPERTDKNGYVEPFQIFDNVFYVGDKWGSSYLVQTTHGLVLIDTLESPYGRWIPGNIKKLGLNPSDIKYILVTHGHSDHVGNAEYIQRLYGSQVVMSEDEFLLAQKQSEKSKGKEYFKPPNINLFVKDGSELVVVETKFTFYITPGHTKGSVFIEFMVKNAGVSYRAFMIGGHSPPRNNIELTKNFIESMRKIRTLASAEPRVSVNLASHPHKNSLFEKRDLGKENDKINYFIDSNGFFEFLNKQEEIGIEKLSVLQENANKSTQPTAKTAAD